MTIADDLDIKPVSERVDLVVAWSSGPSTWATPDSASTPGTFAAAMLVLAGAAASATALIVAIALDAGPRPFRSRVLLVVLTVLCAGVMASCTLSALRWAPGVGRPRGIAFVRITATVVFACIWIATVPVEYSPTAWALGMFIGGEGALIARFVGYERPMRQMVITYLRSPFHLGALTAGLVVVFVARDPRVSRVVITEAISLEFIALGALVTYAAVRQLFRREASFAASVRLAEREAESLRRAHWIHDDVCADVREIRVRLAARQLSQEEVANSLDQLDDRLRIRQLDELLSGGAVAAAEILQPYVRRAQNAGVTLAQVPRFEDASVSLSGPPAVLLRRCIAGFVANALQAGTQTLSIHLARDHDDLLLEVTDDAGGFELADAPDGRGLSSLAKDLGSGRLSATRHDGGTTMTARIALGRAA
ncbi:MAG: hypothetical protein ABMA25_07850 [Ilumatobacteraceae bacterium]